MSQIIHQRLKQLHNDFVVVQVMFWSNYHKMHALEKQQERKDKNIALPWKPAVKEYNMASGVKIAYGCMGALTK